MRRISSMKIHALPVTVILAVFLTLSACSPGDHMIGPRSETAWKEWNRQQEALKETWGDTEVYAYIQTILKDLSEINANVVFHDDFSVDSDGEDQRRLKQLYEDMKYSRTLTLQEFHEKLKDSSLRYAVGGNTDLESISESSDGSYAVTLLYYPNADSMMAVSLTVFPDSGGSFRTEF